MKRTITEDTPPRQDEIPRSVRFVGLMLLALLLAFTVIVVVLLVKG